MQKNIYYIYNYMHKLWKETVCSEINISFLHASFFKIRRVGEGSAKGANRPEKIVTFVFVPQKIKPWKKKQSIFKREEYILTRKVFCVTARNVLHH